jgi:hypothetical protein
MVRTCNICGTTSDAARFYTGVTSRCSECHKQAVRAVRAANVERYRAYDVFRHVRDREKRLAGMKAYAQTERGKAVHAAGHRTWKEQNPHKRDAQIKFGNALRDGKVARGTECECCGTTGRLHGHHDDYSKPLDVRWLCVPCHSAAHHGHPAERAARAAQIARR